MLARLTAARALVGLLLGLAFVVVGVLLAAGPAGQRTAPIGHGSRAPAGPDGQPAAAAGPGARVPVAATGATATTTGPPGRPVQAAADPCRLATRAEVAAVLGQRVAKVQARQGFLVRSCLFLGAGPSRQVIVQVNYGPAASREQFRMARAPGGQPVRGVGDEAWYTPDTGLLDVRKGAARFQVGLLGTAGQAAARDAPPSLLALARNLARRV